ncbi:MAG: DUF4249 family protein [Bacteroidales bacterium]
MNISSCLSILLLISSCSRDMTFSLPETEPLLAVQSLIGPDQDSRVRVTMARGIQDPAIQMDIDCQVDLFENGVFYKSITLDTPAILSGTISTQGYLDFPVDAPIVLSEGKEYSVEVNYPGFETVTASDIKPNAVKINSISWRFFTGEMPDWYYNTPQKLYQNTFDDNWQTKRDTALIEYVINFDDPPEIGDFYQIGINYLVPDIYSISRDTIHYRIQYAIVTDPDPPFVIFNYRKNKSQASEAGNTKDGNSLITYQTTWEILWKDDDFDGSRHSITIIAPRPNVGAKCIISLYSLSETYYKYMIDRWKYYMLSHDPFSEPIRLHSNTSNRCGIFAMYSVDKDTLQF